MPEEGSKMPDRFRQNNPKLAKPWRYHISIEGVILDCKIYPSLYEFPRVFSQFKWAELFPTKNAVTVVMKVDIFLILTIPKKFKQIRERNLFV